MDLSVIKDMLSDFSTFASKIADLATLIPKTLSQVAGWFYDGNLNGETWTPNPAVDADGKLDPNGRVPLNIEGKWNETAEIFKKPEPQNN